MGKVYNEKRRAERMRVLDGYPVETAFTCIDQVREYLSGDLVTCLFCGREFKNLGAHLAMTHAVTPDEYRGKYNIPWTYSLAGKATNAARSAVTAQRIKDGLFVPGGSNRPNLVKMMLSAQKRCEFYKKQIALQNLKKGMGWSFTLFEAPDGSMETLTARKNRLTSPFGSKEHREKMSRIAKANAEKTSKRMMDCWMERKRKIPTVKVFAGRITGKKDDGRWGIQLVYTCPQCGQVAVHGGVANEPGAADGPRCNGVCPCSPDEYYIVETSREQAGSQSLPVIASAARQSQHPHNP